MRLLSESESQIQDGGCSALMTPKKATLDSLRTLSCFVSYRRLSPQFQFSLCAAALGLLRYVGCHPMIACVQSYLPGGGAECIGLSEISRLGGPAQQDAVILKLFRDGRYATLFCNVRFRYLRNKENGCGLAALIRNQFSADQCLRTEKKRCEIAYCGPRKKISLPTSGN